MKVVEPITITDDMVTSINISEDDYPLYSAATSYALDTYVMVVAANVHLIFRSLQAANVGHNPLDDSQTEDVPPTYWLLIGTTNRWRLFDKFYNTQTTHAESISITLDAPGRVTALAALNVEAKSMRVQMTDAIDGLVYDKTYSLIDNSGINDYYPWFFEPIQTLSDIAITDLPNYSNARIDITLSNPDGVVKCGVLLLGRWRQIGVTRSDAQAGITDYSIKKRNSFGTAILQEGDYSKWTDLSLSVSRNEVSRVQNILASYRAKSILYIGTSEDSSLMVYGFYESAQHVVSYADYSIFNLKIEGLT